LGIFVISLLAIQFIPNKLPENKATGHDDITGTGLLTPEITTILKTSCFDCHSNETHFPWYSKLAPSSWLLASDINRGRDKLNFSEWKSYSKRHQIGKLEAIKEEITSGDMPLKVYTIIHRKARLTKKQVSAVAGWTDEVSKKILE